MEHALDIAKRMYDKAGMSLEVDIAHYLRHGYVFSAPDKLLLGAPMSTDHPERIAKPGEADAWYVRLAVGKGAMRWFIENMPWYLPKVAWHRDFKKPTGILHVWSTDIVCSKIR